VTLRIARLGEPRDPQEGTRIGTVRRPPRGVRKERYAPDDWFDVWFADLAPSAELMAAWITLNVHSALEAVGLTAAFASALGKAGISCNVIAGYYHDHLFVGQADAERAMHVLRDLAANAE